MGGKLKESMLASKPRKEPPCCMATPKGRAMCVDRWGAGGGGSGPLGGRPHFLDSSQKPSQEARPALCRDGATEGKRPHSGFLSKSLGFFPNLEALCVAMRQELSGTQSRSLRVGHPCGHSGPQTPLAPGVWGPGW